MSADFLPGVEDRQSCYSRDLVETSAGHDVVDCNRCRYDAYSHASTMMCTPLSIEIESEGYVVQLRIRFS